MNYKRFRYFFGKDKVFMEFAFVAIAFNIKKMCEKLTKEGRSWLIGWFYELITAVIRYREHINQRNPRIIGKHPKKYTLHRLGFDCSFALAKTIKP